MIKSDPDMIVDDRTKSRSKKDPPGRLQGQTETEDWRKGLARAKFPDSNGSVLKVRLPNMENRECGRDLIGVTKGGKSQEEKSIA